MAETGANPARLELENTEGVLLEDDDLTRRTLNALRQMGFSLALDDSGAGYSSLELTPPPADGLRGYCVGRTPPRLACVAPAAAANTICRGEHP